MSLFALSGCATQSAYFKIDPALYKTAVDISGIQYMPLADVCRAYSLDYKWDTFTNTVAIEKGGAEIVLRAGSNVILVDGGKKELARPIAFTGGAIFVPTSFVKNYIGRMAGLAGEITPVPVPEAPKRFTVKTIVLDPGHGGKDVGALGRRFRTREKDLALRLALNIRKILEGAGIKVIMTRSDDTFVSLSRRADIANRSGADIFVSVHINASRSKSLHGFECYFLSNAADDNARALEAFEDSSLKLGESAVAERSNQLDKTLWDMALTENRIESAQLASHICGSVERSLSIRNRGVRTARFYVLKRTNIPSVLVEAGYLSNRYDEKKINDPKFLGRVAEAVAAGILSYKKEYEDTEGYTK